MLKLNNIKKDARIRGIEPGKIIRVVTVEWVGDAAVTVYYKDSEGRLSEQMLFRSDEERLEIVEEGQSWAFDAPGDSFKLCIEAYRIRYAHLFDPMMAVHTSNVEPLPHQISAVYEAMLPRQPLRFVLADDPGAGKTIMAGLLIKELMVRADAKRVLVVAPGSLCEQWQDELLEKFDINFEIFSRQGQERSASGNYFNEEPLVLARLDQLSRNEEFQQKLKASEWDLIIVDEAHKLSASYWGNKVNKTKRFLLGEILGSITRHFLLMTATPHNGKEEDFQIWLSLLDGDRFYGKFREGAHQVDVSDIMRREVKEHLLKFNGEYLFPERWARTANYALSDQEAALYADVTDYVRNEMNRAESLQDGKRRGNVGFALTLLQRRLASSPEAIYQSLQRRHKKLEDRLREMKLLERGQAVAETLRSVNDLVDIPEDIDDIEDELNAEEYEQHIDEVIGQETASETIPELKAEILSLKNLESKARDVVRSGNDRKWEELSSLLQDTPEMVSDDGHRRKLIIFTEHRDTQNYLVDRITGLLGSEEAVVTIHGGVNRDDRRKVQEEFRNNEDVQILVATDAAGEGINLQNANLMVNYDLPWNPNRLEQRFGRIHRIGQTEVCYLWNMVASETREGEVFQRLFEKIAVQKEALGGRVFDVLGEAFENTSLKDLLIKAIRSDDMEDTREDLTGSIDEVLNTEHLKKIMKRNALVDQHMNREELFSIKEDMEKAEARKLQPHFIRAFFTEAFKTVGGEIRPREEGRYQVPHVPAALRERDRVISESRTPVLKKYARICFDKSNIRFGKKPMADLVHPAHPLMHTTIDLVLSKHRAQLKQGAVMVDPNDESVKPRVLFMIDHSVRETSGDPPRIVSRLLQFVSIDEGGQATHAGWAPHLDLQPIDDHELSLVRDVLTAPWVSDNLERDALAHASEALVPEHYREVKSRRERQATKTLGAVHDRLVKEIQHWSERFVKLTEDVASGRQPRMQPENARRRAEEITARLEQRTKELENMKNVVSSTPVVVGGALVIPQGMLAQRKGETTFSADPVARSRIERIAMDAVMEVERGFGHEVLDVSAEKCGWDVTARPPQEGDRLLDDRHIEIKGRAKGQSTITVSYNELLYALNQADKFILAIVVVDGDEHEGPYYIRDPFTQEPDYGVASINYSLKGLLSKAVPPEQTLATQQ